MDPVTVQQILDCHFGPGVELLSIDQLQGDRAKHIRYSRVWRVRFLDASAGRRSVILRTPLYMADGDHHLSNRLRHALWQFQAFNRLRQHASAYGVGAVGADGTYHDLSDLREPIILEEDIEGPDLVGDLWEEANGSGELQEKLVACGGLLREIHRCDLPPDADYRRSLREYTARYFRLLDVFPPESDFVARYGQAVTKSAVHWYWRLRDRTERLCVIHGDFHPGNILFRDGKIRLIDRKHMEFGDPNEDVAALIVNIVIAALARHGKLVEPSVSHLRGFFTEYLKGGVNADYAECLPPFILTRLLVLANPGWYSLEGSLRETVWQFIDEVCELDRLAWQDLVERFS